MINNKTDLILDCLEKTYAGTATALNYNSSFELLVAVILSAQCTGERVNKVTTRIFPKYNQPQKLAKLSQEELEVLIHDCGLFRSKAKNILATCRKLLQDYAGIVPDNIKDLMLLPGVGKKTANVIVNIVYGVPAIAVDTHVFRVSHRLGLSNGKDPETVENDLMAIIPRNKWGEAHHWLIWHGRKICKSRKPACDICVLSDLCPYGDKNLGNNK